MLSSASKYLPSIKNIVPMLQTQKEGLSVMGSELQWVAVRSLRVWEIRQLRKRLQEEYTALGTLDAEGASDSKEATLSRKQVSFLQEEIDHLEQELIRARQEFVRRRVRSS